MHFLKRSDMAIHSFTCKQAMPAFTPQPQSITALRRTLENVKSVSVQFSFILKTNSQTAVSCTEI